MVVFVVKQYAVREAKKKAVREAKIGRCAVRKGGGGCHPHIYHVNYNHTINTDQNLIKASFTLSQCTNPVSPGSLQLSGQSVFIYPGSAMDHIRCGAKIDHGMS